MGRGSTEAAGALRGRGKEQVGRHHCFLMKMTHHAWTGAERAGRNIEKLQLLPLKGYKRHDYSNESWAQGPGRTGRRPASHSIPATHRLCDPEQVISYFGDLSLLLVNKDMGQAGLRVTLSLTE